MIIKRFTDEIYDVNLLVIADCTLEEVNIYLAKRISDYKPFNIGTNGFAMSFKSETKKYVRFYDVIWVKERRDFYCLIHEVLHLVHFIFDRKGVPIHSNNTEAIAYYQEYWFKRIWRIIGKDIVREDEKKENDSKNSRISGLRTRRNPNRPR